MKTKLNTIRNRFILFTLLIIVFGLLIGYITHTSVLKINRNNEILNSVDLIKINNNEIKAEINEFLNEDIYNLAFYKTGKSESVTDFKQLYQVNMSLIDDIIEKDKKITVEIKDKLISVRDKQEKFGESFNSIIDNLRDRGYESYGLVGNLVNQYTKLKDQLATIEDFTIYDQVQYVINLSTTFSENLRRGTYNELVYTIDEVTSLIKMSSTGDNLTGYSAILNQLELIRSTSSKIIAINDNIGIEGDKGLYKELMSTWGDLNNLLFELSETIKERIPVMNKRVLNFQFISLIIAIMVLVLLFLGIANSITRSIKNLRNYTNRILHGELPERLELRVKDELNTIAGFLSKIIDELKNKARFARDLSENKLNTEYTPLSEQDDLGNSLIDLRSGLQVAAEEEEKHRVENEKRRWTNEGLAKFGEILRANNDNTELLCDNIIKNLVKYLDSNQGGIYLYNDENKDDIHLDMISAFAFDRKKYLEKKIALGEGLVGTCALEKHTIYMKEIPDDYITITSGLGGAIPRSLLIVPLKLEDDVLGVAEIASFNELEEHEIEFVEKIAESIASTLSSAKINERTAQLLAQSQKQAQEMAEQEEEMRQNMEELQATQEESARRESEMSGLLQAINSATYVLEFDMDGYIMECNERLLFLLEMQRDAVIGMHHSEFTSMNKNSPEYINFWKELNEGNTKTKVQKFESISGNEIWLKQNYTPIFNKEGQALKVVCISTDITENVYHEKNIQKKERAISTFANENEYLNNTLNVAFIKADIDSEGRITDVNKNFENTVGYSKKELIGKKFAELIAKDEINNFNRLLESVKNGTVFNNLLKFNYANGTQGIIKSLMNPIISDSRQLTKIIFIGQEYSSSEE